MERVILAAGGTGGHIFPALAVAEELRRRHAGVRVIFAGSLHGPERKLAARAGLEFAGLPVRGFLGRGMRALGAAAGMALALAQAVRLMRRFRPQVVAGFGGYAAFAPVAAAWLCGVPSAVHEQNAVAGVSNKLLARLARKVFLSLPDVDGVPSGKCVLTGNPVRRAVAEGGGANHDFAGKRLLVMGGSQGARALNELIGANLPRLRDAGARLRWQTGEEGAEAAEKACAAAGYAAETEPFIADMAAAYRWADLALCRAGATTVAELAAAGKPAVLVPFPHATHDHQTRNARILADGGAAVLIPEKDLAGMDVIGSLLELLNDADKLRAMGRAAFLRARPDAAAHVAAELENMALPA